MSLTKRTHKSEQTGEPREMHHGILTRAHMSDSPRKIRMSCCQVGSAEPGQHPVQMHFDVACPLLLLLITFHICIWREPTLKTIKGASLHLSPHTPTHLSFISPSYPCSSVPLGVLHLVVYLEKRRRVGVEERSRACRNLLSFCTSTDLLQLELLPGYLPIFLKLLFV